ncbi:colipase-like protein 2 [Pipistrellus kuhlii]|uniref:Colipase like 2 n=1 Tax=Pipistrellus kuhlii TaxID=59472 RepID=A0A7J7YKW1_PIPKU|nr:colipase-like protein 2 [Pipistrellus kuhlii]KAF6362677.1 colipase like 2 [Pipistrellus kuhlii]
MATALAILAGLLLPCGGSLPPLRRQSLLKRNGARCSHHLECSSDCCLMNLDTEGDFCAPRGRKSMVCLPQTKRDINIICPCRGALRCIPKDPSCPRRCSMI